MDYLYTFWLDIQTLSYLVNKLKKQQIGMLAKEQISTLKIQLGDMFIHMTYHNKNGALRLKIVRTEEIVAMTLKERYSNTYMVKMKLNQ